MIELGFIVRNNVNIVEETCNALFFIVNEEESMKGIIEKFDKLGLDNEKYIKKELKNLFKFKDKFKEKNKVPMDILKKYFKATNDGDTACIADLFMRNVFLEELDANKDKVLEMAAEKLRELAMKEILSGLDFMPEDFSIEPEEAFKNIDVSKEFMPFLINKCSLSEEAKWYITIIVQDPKTYLIELLDIVIKSVEVFKETFKVMEKDVEEIVKTLQEEIDSNEKYIAEVTGIKALEKWDGHMYVQPSMIKFNAVSIQCSQSFIFDTPRRDNLYFGWRFKNLLEISHGKNKEEEILNSRLKCLSDKSKFTILKFLKEKPMFGQEIAEALSLTTATVSHHMNSLIFSKLVNIERIENRIYYTINSESIDEILEMLTKELK